MPEFTTPGPIDLAVDLQAGRLEVVATDRTDTVVTVSPANPDKALDRKAAEATRVEFDGTRLTVAGPRRFSLIGPFESIDVRVELPSGSRVTGDVSWGPVTLTGRYGATRLKATGGFVEIGDTADLWVNAGHGNLDVGTVSGSLEATAAHGNIKVGTVTGDARLKASHGSVTVGEAGSDLDANLAYGEFDLDRALGSVTAKTAYGSIRIGEVSTGSIRVESGYGSVRIGIKPGVAAWLDVSSKNGRVRNELDTERAPEGADQSVEVRARTQASDITIQHSK